MTLPWMYTASPHTTVDCAVTAAGLPHTYWANLDLRDDVNLFGDGIRPVMAATEMAKLLADLATIGDEAHQLAQLGWTVRPAIDGAPAGTLLFRFASPDQDDQPITPRDGLWYELPAEPGWTLGDLPALARLHLARLRLNAIDHEVFGRHAASDAIVADGSQAARALGQLLADLLIRTRAATRPGSHATLLGLLTREFNDGLNDGGLGGSGSVLPYDGLSARLSGYHLSDRAPHVVAAMTEADINALIAELDLLPGDLGRWKGNATEHRDITISPDTFTGAPLGRYARVLDHLRTHHLHHTQHAETVYTPPFETQPQASPTDSATDDRPPAPSALSLERIADLLNQRGIPAIVDGTISISAIYIGASWQDDIGDTHYQLIAGPGTNARAWSDAWSDTGEFGVSRDDHGTTPEIWTSASGDTEQDCVEAIAALLTQVSPSPARLQP